MTMRLNTLKPAAGAKSVAKRVGRGRGSGTGNTAGRGHKGQKSRSGGYHKVGFEGGQMPLQRRLPKRGFRSLVNKHTAEIRLHELAKVEGDVVDLPSLQKAGVIGLHITRAKAILSGEISRAVTLRGVGASKGARAAIEKAGGTVEEAEALSKASSKTTRKTTKKAVAKKTAAKKPAVEKVAKDDSKADTAAPVKPKAASKTETKIKAKAKTKTKAKAKPEPSD